jgi:hypothetical protein
MRLQDQSRWLTRAARPLAAAVALTAAGGCAFFDPADKAEHFSEEESTLNTLDIYYVTGLDQPVTRLELMGSGHCRVRRGASPQLMNAFSQDVKDRNWNDLSVDQLTLEPAEMRRIFQAFVDRGLMRKQPAADFADAAKRGAPFARALGTINNNVVCREVAEPELLSLIAELIKAFEHPTQ